ncbi:glycosyltransferase family 4 protein [Halobacteriaceae archaeon GCM10025711]
MKVSVLTPDLSHNCLGRAHVLAELLERYYDVEIVGPKLRGDVWKPLQEEHEYKGIETSERIYDFTRKVPGLLSSISGDVIYASKPKVSSYGMGLLSVARDERPLLLDVDDWESGFFYGAHGRFYTYAWAVPRLINANSFYYTRILERFSTLADARTVSNHFLKEKFGGTVIPHVRDTDVFDPDRYDKVDARKRFDLPEEETLVMFSGTPRPHKGVDDLVRGVSSLNKEDVRVVVIGAHESPYTKELKRIGGDKLILRGQQPFDQLPAWIAAADIIAIPQKDTSGTKGQLPAKVFDAMAMAKPIIATAVGDLPIVLDDSGKLVEPDSPAAIAAAIEELMENPEKRITMGEAARKRCVENYSFDAMAPKLKGIIEKAA